MSFGQLMRRGIEIFGRMRAVRQFEMRGRSWLDVFVTVGCWSSCLSLLSDGQRRTGWLSIYESLSEGVEMALVAI